MVCPHARIPVEAGRANSVEMLVEIDLPASAYRHLRPCKIALQAWRCRVSRVSGLLMRLPASPICLSRLRARAVYRAAFLAHYGLISRVIIGF